MFSSTQQILWRTQHLMLAGSGTWWAMWRLEPMSYTNPDPKWKEQVRASHQALFQALRGEALLLGLTTREDHLQVVNRMMQGVRMNECPEYLEEVELTLGALEQMTIGGRGHWLAVPLKPANVKARALTAARASWQGVQHTLALPASRPSDYEIAAAFETAAKVESIIPGVFHPVRATPAEHTWIHYQAQLRGIEMLDALPTQAPDQAGAALIRSGRELSPALVDEGGQSDIPKAIGRFNPFNRRYLKVQSLRADVPSYQCMLAVTGTPANGWVFPGIEWLSWLDQMPFDVDWAIRAQVFSAEVSKKKNARSEGTLEDQLHQQSSDTAAITGSAGQLDKNIHQLAAFHSKMSADEREVEVQATMIFAVGGAQPEEAKEKARLLKDAFKANEFVLEDALGDQERLWEAMQPGVPTSSTVRELAQLTTGSDFASTVPLISFNLGDDHGILFAENQETNQGRPMFIDPYGSTLANFSGSIALCGELGGGKSVTLKKLGGAVVDRGGRIFVIDRSATKEYKVFAQALVPDQTAVVDILDPDWSLDPIRMFGIREAPRMTQTLLTSLLRMETFDERGSFLGEVLDPMYMERNSITSLKKLLAHLETLEVDEARSLARAMKSIASKPDLGACLFDDSLPPLPLDARATVFCTSGLHLPSTMELKNDAQWTRLTLDKIFGSAIYDLLAEIGRAVCFATDTEFAAFIADEAHHMTMQARGHEICMEFVREGRKSAAAIFIASQTPNGIGEQELRDLIPVKIVHRLSGDLAEEGARLLSPKSWSTALVKKIEQLSPPDPRDPDRKVPVDRRGECMILDSRKRIGKGRVLLPYEPSRRKAVTTTPPREQTREKVQA